MSAEDVLAGVEAAGSLVAAAASLSGTGGGEGVDMLSVSAA